MAVFGDGDASLADSLIAFTMRTSGGVDPATGVTSDPRFNLVAESWVSRFRQATMVPDVVRGVRSSDGWRTRSETGSSALLYGAADSEVGGRHRRHAGFLTRGDATRDVVPPVALKTAVRASDVFGSVTNCVPEGFASSWDM